MTANQIAQLIGLTTQCYVDYGLTAKECADLTAALFKTAKDLGIGPETVKAFREVKLRNYEAPANG